MLFEFKTISFSNLLMISAVEGLPCGEAPSTPAAPFVHENSDDLAFLPVAGAAPIFLSAKRISAFQGRQWERLVGAFGARAFRPKSRLEQEQCLRPRFVCARNDIIYTKSTKIRRRCHGYRARRAATRNPFDSAFVLRRRSNPAIHQGLPALNQHTALQA